MRCRLRAAALAACALVAVGCGSTSTETIVVTTTVSASPLSHASTGQLTVGPDLRLDVTKVAGANCDNTFNFGATGSLSGTGTLIYHFERSDGQRTDDIKVPINGYPSFSFTTSWRFIGQRTGMQTMTFIITAPTTRQASRDFDTTCP